MSGLREAMFNAIWRCGFAPHEDPATVERMKAEWPEAIPKAQKRADAAILALRQWMDAEGLTIVPDDVSNWHVRFTQFASGEVQSALDSAPDVLGKP